MKSNLKKEDIERMWEDFSRNVSINTDGVLEEDFHTWKAGESKQIIWQWFDEVYEGGVSELITCF